MNRFLALFILLATLGTANAACPDIAGNWAIVFDETYLGNQFAGIGRAEITGNKIKLRLREGYQGDHRIGTFTGNYSVQNNCMVTWNYQEREGEAMGVMHGIIVSVDKIFFMFSNPSVYSTGKIIAERITYE